MIAGIIVNGWKHTVLWRFLETSLLFTSCLMDPLDSFQRDKDIDPGSDNYPGYHTVESADDILPHVGDGADLFYQDFLVSNVLEAYLYGFQISASISFTSVLYDNDSYTHKR